MQVRHKSGEETLILLEPTEQMGGSKTVRTSACVLDACVGQ